MPLTCRLSQAVIAITGASSGIGAATAVALAKRGGHVILIARNTLALKEVAQQCREAGGEATVAPADVTNADVLAAVATDAYQKQGKLDGWINNAGIGVYGTVEQIPVSEFRRVIEVNIFGYFHGIVAALPYLRRSGGGVIINNVSMLSEIALPYQAPYITSKHAIIGLSEALRQDLLAEKETTISVCDLIPAGIDTSFFNHAANHTGRPLRPVPPVYRPEQAAQDMIALLTNPQQIRHVGGVARVITAMAQQFPRFSAPFRAWYGKVAQFRHTGTAQSTTGDLFHLDEQPRKAVTTTKVT